jgi:hypothetical protein
MGAGTLNHHISIGTPEFVSSINEIHYQKWKAIKTKKPLKMNF